REGEWSGAHPRPLDEVSTRERGHWVIPPECRLGGAGCLVRTSPNITSIWPQSCPRGCERRRTFVCSLLPQVRRPAFPHRGIQGAQALRVQGAGIVGTWILGETFVHHLGKALPLQAERAKGLRDADVLAQSLDAGDRVALGEP